MFGPLRVILLLSLVDHDPCFYNAETRIGVFLFFQARGTANTRDPVNADAQLKMGCCASSRTDVSQYALSNSDDGSSDEELDQDELDQARIIASLKRKGFERQLAENMSRKSITRAQALYQVIELLVKVSNHLLVRRQYFSA